jgi:hypothetical protein
VPHPERAVMPLLVRAWDMIIELVSTALRAPPPADCWPHRPSGQSRLAGVRAPTIAGGSQSVMTAAGGEARKPADLRGLWHYRRWPLRCADLVSLARGALPGWGPGSGVVVFVPQLVSKAARRGDRLDGEAVFEAA